MGCDPDSDLRLERRLKRRCVANQCFNPNSYSNAAMVKNNRGRERLELLKYRMSNISKHSDYNYTDVDLGTDALIDGSDNDNYEDDEYKMFLNNLKEVGNSYALEVFLDNGVSELMNYEVMVDESRLDRKKSIESCPVNWRTKGEVILKRDFEGERKEVRNSRAELSCGDEEDFGSMRLSRHQLRNERREIMETSDYGLVKRGKSCLTEREHLDPVSGGTTGGTGIRSGSEDHYWVEHQRNHEDEHDDVDEEYYKFLNPFLGGTSGSSYIRPGSGEFENEDSDTDYGKLLDLSYAGTSEHSSRKQGLEGDHLVKRGLEREDESDDTFRKYLTVLDCNVVDDEVTAYGFDGSPERFDEVQENVIGHKCNQEDQSDDVTQDYLAFLDYLEKAGEDSMYKSDDIPERFDQDEKIECDLQIAASYKDLHSGGDCIPSLPVQTSVYVDLDDWNLAKDPSTSQSQFRKRLMEILKSPYDSEQHKALWCEVSRRRLKVKDRNFRSGRTKSCPVENSFDKSYLDHYCDFAEQIDLAQYDEHKSLNLLRGFFYWLENLTHEGAFPPWKDPSCLEVLPQ